jgi:hypothetical protein
MSRVLRFPGSSVLVHAESSYKQRPNKTEHRNRLRSSVSYNLGLENMNYVPDKFKSPTLLIGFLVLLIPGCIPFSDPDFGMHQSVEVSQGIDFIVAIERLHWTEDSGETHREFVLNLQIEKPTRPYSSITVSKIVAQYDDGTVDRMMRAWSREFPPSYIGVHPLSTSVKTIYFRHEDVTVTFAGHLMTLKGEKIPFAATKKFKAGRYVGSIPILWCLGGAAY